MKIDHQTGYFRGAGNTRLFFQRWRPAGKAKNRRTVLVLVHGLAEHSDRYQFPVGYFTPRGFSIYAMDLRGHGGSGGQKGYAESLDQLLEDIRLFLGKVREAEGGKKIFLIGHSFGGQLVLNYGVRHPAGLTGMIISSPNIRLKMPLPLIKRLMAPILSRALPRLALGNELDSTLVSHDPKVVEAYRDDPRVQKKITTRLADLMLGNQLEMPSLAGKFRVPCLLMHAGDDRICDPEGTREFFEKIPIHDKTLKIFDGFYHELFNEVDREKVFKTMEGWIEKRI